MSRRGHLLLAVALALTQAGWSAYLTEGEGLPIRWYDEVIPVVMDAAGTADVEGDQEFLAIRQSMRAWNQVDRCAHPLFLDDGLAEALEPGSPDDGATGRNLVVFEDAATWARRGHESEDRVIALTTLYYSASSGAARKFDLELADGRHEFTVTDDTELARTDIRNTVTHELGHALGLDHSTHEGATMFASAREGDLQKRTLAPDDIAGLCAIYGDWSPDGGGDSCAAGASGAAGLMVLLLCAGAAVVLGRRRLTLTPWGIAVAYLAATGPGWEPLRDSGGPPVRLPAGGFVLAPDGEGTPDVDGDTEWGVISEAMEVWNRVPCGQPRIELGRPGEEAPARVRFGEAELSGEPDVIAYALVAWDESGTIREGELVFNDDFPFSATDDPCGVSYDLGSIALHELGHFLGLGHSGDREATMYPYYSCGLLYRRDAGLDDVRGLCSVYGGDAPGTWEGGPLDQTRCTGTPRCGGGQNVLGSTIMGSVTPRSRLEGRGCGAAADGSWPAVLATAVALAAVASRRAR